MEKVVGATYSLCGPEFVLHILDEYDYHFASSLKIDIIHQLRSLRAEAGEVLYLWERQVEDLSEYVTQKKDRKCGVTKIPMVDSAINYVRPARPQSSARRIYPTEGLSPDLEDFDFLRELSHGGSGPVDLMRRRDTNDFFAMKTLPRDAFSSELDDIVTKRLVSANESSPFLVKFCFFFCTDAKLMFLTEFLQGGSLFFHVKKTRKIDEEKARFYAAEILLGLRTLRAENIVFWDLKPKHVLLRSSGHVALTDFVIVKRAALDPELKNNSLEYLAPELISGRGPCTNSDLWSFGIILYEMMVGIPPFYNENIKVLFELVRSGDLKFPIKASISPLAEDLIRKLLDRNPYTRLGYRGTQEVCAHPFFENVDWNLIWERRISPPYAPITSEENFAANFESKTTSLTVTRRSSFADSLG